MENGKEKAKNMEKEDKMQQQGRTMAEIRDTRNTLTLNGFCFILVLFMLDHIIFSDSAAYRMSAE